MGSCLLAESWHWRDKLPEAVQELRRTHEGEAQGLDIAPETLRKMVNDCIAFQRANEALLGASGLGAELAGHDFWLTRNHHGSGFWDEDIGDVGRKLSETASSYGECNLYIGDDKRIYGV